MSTDNHHAAAGEGTTMRQDAHSYDLLLDRLARRRLDGTALLWLSGHQPLAFVAGQICWLVAPLALLFGWTQVETWAAILSTPHSGTKLVHDLHRRAQQYRPQNIQ